MRKIALISAAAMMTVAQIGSAAAMPLDAGNPLELGMKRKCAPGSRLRACQKPVRHAAVRRARPRPAAYDSGAETAAANRASYVPEAVQPAPAAPAPTQVATYTPQAPAPAAAGISPGARAAVAVAAFTAFLLGLIAALSGDTRPRGPEPTDPGPDPEPVSP